LADGRGLVDGPRAVAGVVVPSSRLHEVESGSG
jgi:hypothetical protein